MYIAIAGNIGSGKTTLTEILTKRYGAKAYYEDIANPYISDFYEDMGRWSFHLQLWFLGSRIQQTLVMLSDGSDNVIQDRTIYEDARIFAPNLHAMGLMNTRDFETYKSLFELMESFITPPDLLIYLKASVPTLIKQIERRGREYESSIRLDYITSLNNRYNSWIEEYSNRKLIINMDDLNITENPKDLGFVVDSINAEINGLF